MPLFLVGVQLLRRGMKPVTELTTELWVRVFKVLQGKISTFIENIRFLKITHRPPGCSIITRSLAHRARRVASWKEAVVGSELLDIYFAHFWAKTTGAFRMIVFHVLLPSVMRTSGGQERSWKGIQSTTHARRRILDHNARNWGGGCSLCSALREQSL
jgi:hypothetical protein